LDAVTQGRFGSYIEFCNRYCDRKLDFFGHWQAKGATNSDELRDRMAPFCIFGQKESVLTLPIKTRYFVELKLQPEAIKEMNGMRATYQKLSREAAKSQKDWDIMKAKQYMMEMWMTTSRLKTPQVYAWLDANLGQEKMVIFAHHVSMMDALQGYLETKQVKFIR